MIFPLYKKNSPCKTVPDMMTNSVDYTNDKGNVFSTSVNLSHIFSENGILASAVPGFRPRPQQQAMAEAVSEAIENRTTLVAEAGTGTGKTFAYLAPVLLSGRKAIISTATKTLQDQLFKRDIPSICRALNTPVRCALLKGRDNYICRYRLNRAEQYTLFPSDQSALQTIRTWAETTETGDKVELASISDQSLIWQSVTSTKDNCLGSDCPNFSDCFVVAARRNAQCADIVVVNHHLFLADLILKDDGVGELLPKVDVRIFDEAHQLPDVASIFFSKTVSTNQCLALLSDLLAEFNARPADLSALNRTFRPMEDAVRLLRRLLPHGSGRFSKNQIQDQYDIFFDALDQLCAALQHLYDVLQAQDDGGPEIAQLAARTHALGVLVSEWRQSDDTEAATQSIDWVETTKRHVKLHRTPMNVGDTMRAYRQQYPGSWIFLSATLAVERSFSHFIQDMGLEDPLTGYWESPFHYDQQALLVIPYGLPEPNTFAHTRAVVETALPLVPVSTGGAFFLFTSLSAVSTAETIVTTWLSQQGLTDAVSLLVQGTQSRTELLAQFRTAKKAILLGSHSFWEGIDMPGDLLSLVVIDKIPFQPPDDPVLNAKSRLLAKQGKNSFMTLQLPKAVISLKQGAGRLIRSETDRGVLILGDPRLLTKSYGSKILRSLPFANITRHVDDAIRLFQAFRVDAASHKDTAQIPDATQKDH